MNIFKGLFDTSTTEVIEIGDFLICVLAALVLGFVLAGVYMVRSRYTGSFVITLAMLPTVVTVVIMMVNGNLGAGVAVAGAFSLVRFRSVPGSAKEICMLFLAMGTGLITGMGYIAYAALFTLIMSLVFLVYTLSGFGEGRGSDRHRIVRITVPEGLNYTGAFDGIFTEYASSFKLVKVKTVNLGSMFRLTYELTLKDIKDEKTLIDKIRERNGNLEITVSHQSSIDSQL